MIGPQKRFFLFFFFIFGILIGCKEHKWKVDTSEIKYNSNLKRFDLEWVELSKQGISQEELKSLNQKYPEWMPLYLNGILRLGDLDQAENRFELNQLVLNADIKSLYQKVINTYPNESLNKEIIAIEEALKRYAYFFPETQLPEIYTLISLFNYNIVVDEGLLGICLEMYLGADYEVYPQTSIPRYRFKNFERSYMASDAIKAFLISEFDQGGGENLLEQMLFYGKIAYLQEALMPEEEQKHLFNYDEKELEWCVENESEIWFHLVDMELLYTLEAAKIRKYLDDAPFIPGFPEGSSARVGKWLGYRIIAAYMDAHPNMSLQELMKLTNANEILRQSTYKPNR